LEEFFSLAWAVVCIAPVMKKPWRIAGLVVAAALIIAIISAAFSGTREPEYEGRKLTQWLEDLRHSPSGSPFARTNAIIAIRHMGTNAVPYLLTMLHARDSRLKTKCMDLLSRQRLVDFHFRYDFERRDDALRGLGALGSDARAAIPEVAKLMNDRLLAQMAAYTLHQIGADAVPALNQALRSTNTWARSQAAGFLGVSGDEASVPSLIAALKDPDFITKSRATHALSRFPEQADVIVPALTDCLNDSYDTFRMNAARALGAFGKKAKPAFPNLMTMVTSTNYQEGTTAATVLMKIDSEAALTGFIKNLDSQDIDVRRTTAWALMVTKARGKPAVPALVKCLKDRDNTLKQNAAVALREIGEEPDIVVPALMDNLNDPDLKVRSITAIALSSFGEKARPAVPTILKLLEENKNDELTAGGLYNALVKIDPEAAEKLGGK
jgi:HEAT repeat protein